MDIEDGSIFCTMKKVYVHTFTEPRKEADERVNQRIEKAYDYLKITQEDS